MLRAILERVDAVLVGAVSTTEEQPFGFHAVTYDPAVTMFASWRQGMDCTFERIEDVFFTIHMDFHALVIYVAANFAGLR